MQETDIDASENVDEFTRDIDQLRIIPLFNEISEEKLKFISNKIVYNWLDENEKVLKQGDYLHSVFFIIRGHVHASYTSHSGKVIFMQEFGPGNMFGEVAAFDGHPSDATFEAREKTLIGTISSSDYRDICLHDPFIAEAAFHALAKRTRLLIRHLKEMTTLGVNNRIHAELLRRGRRGLISNNTSEIIPAPTHADIAFRVNTQREVVTRELNHLEALGIIQKTRSSIVIKCMVRLEALVESAVGNRE